MRTPIYNFVKAYSDSATARFHMPGHKGKELLGIEKYDITEIGGADVLYDACSIIDESENNATELFGTAHTYYSTEGSTLAIKAMLAIAYKNRKNKSSGVILAARNVHKAFVNACALLDLDVQWIGLDSEHICKSTLTANDVRAALENAKIKPFAVYITSPDYLGNVADIRAIADVCDEYGVPLLVDNAHGAYLAFLKPSVHPIALGAAMCADSAHKTLPALTGAAYLHVSKRYSEYTKIARETLGIFASTSPSYLTLASLDLTNKYLAESFEEKLKVLSRKISDMKSRLAERGLVFEGDEPIKIVIAASKMGYSGNELAEYLRGRKIECEFSDLDYLVLMATPENTDAELDALESALAVLECRPALEERVAKGSAVGKRALSIREATFAPCEVIDVREAIGRICGSSTVSCPPAVPIVISGEIIDERAVALLEYYGIEKIKVLK